MNAFIFLGKRGICKMLFLIFSDMSSLTLEDIDSVSEVDRDTLAPLPPPSWNNVYHNPYGPTPAYLPPPPPGAYIPPKPYNYTPNDSASYVSMPQGNGSIHSGSGESFTSMYSSMLLLPSL